MTSLTDRYIAATLIGVPEGQRNDVERELRASIADAVDAAVDGGIEASAAERQALLELGDPAKLSASYAERPLYLIGPEYFLPWRRLLIVLLSVLPAFVAVVNFLLRSALASEPSGIADALVDAIVLALAVAVQVAFWVTAAFAALERVPNRYRFGTWTPDSLPDPTAKQSRSDSVATIVFAGLVIAALVWQQFATVASTESGPVDDPFLAPTLWSFWLPVLILVLVGQIVVGVLRLRASARSWGLDVAKLVLDVAFPLIVLFLAARGMLVNPAFLRQFDSAPMPLNGGVIDLFVALGAAVVIVITLIDFAVKAVRARRPVRTA